MSMIGVSSLHSPPQPKVEPLELTSERRWARDLAPPRRVAEVDANKNKPEGDDREVQTSQPNCDGRDDHTHKCSHYPGSGQPDPDRQAVAPDLAVGLAAEVHGGTGTNAHEECVTERDLPTDPGQNVEAERGHGQNQHEADDPEPLLVAQETNNRNLVDNGQVEGHQEQDDNKCTDEDLLCPGWEDL